MILSINHIQLVAEKDLVLKLRDFYCDVVGLSEGFRPAFERFGFWLYIGDKDVLHLITPKKGDERSLQKSSFDHVAFKTGNYQSVLKKIESLNIYFEEKYSKILDLIHIYIENYFAHNLEKNNFFKNFRIRKKINHIIHNIKSINNDIKSSFYEINLLLGIR